MGQTAQILAFVISVDLVVDDMCGDVMLMARLMDTCRNIVTFPASGHSFETITGKAVDNLSCKLSEMSTANSNARKWVDGKAYYCEIAKGDGYTTLTNIYADPLSTMEPTVSHVDATVSGVATISGKDSTVSGEDSAVNATVSGKDATLSAASPSDATISPLPVTVSPGDAKLSGGIGAWADDPVGESAVAQPSSELKRDETTTDSKQSKIPKEAARATTATSATRASKLGKGEDRNACLVCGVANPRYKTYCSSKCRRELRKRQGA
uniref:Uncharacterized protein n=1 Tax=Amorphochlora amoebiformis TaxID=1561963 RepID=A0A7S0D443_9EUKA